VSTCLHVVAASNLEMFADHVYSREKAAEVGHDRMVNRLEENSSCRLVPQLCHLRY
jgi:hypothetical protein